MRCQIPDVSQPIVDCDRSVINFNTSIDGWVEPSLWMFVMLLGLLLLIDWFCTVLIFYFCLSWFGAFHGAFSVRVSEWGRGVQWVKLCSVSLVVYWYNVMRCIAWKQKKIHGRIDWIVWNDGMQKCFVRCLFVLEWKRGDEDSVSELVPKCDPLAQFHSWR